MTLSDNELLPPAGYYRTTMEWFVDCRSSGSEAEPNLIQLYSEYGSEFTMPKGLDGYYVPREYHQRFHSNAFVAVIPDGRLWGPRGAVITPDNKLLWDVSLEYWGQPPEQHFVFQQTGLPPVQYCPGTLGVLTYTASDSYFHWLMDVLPRLGLIRKTGIAINKFVFNSFNDPPPAYVFETLDMLGVPSSATIIIGGNVHLKADQLVVPSLIGYHSNYPDWAVHFLKQEFCLYTAAEKLSEYKRIYISRDDAEYRKVVNENQVMELLDKYGFTKVTLSGLSVAEQIRIFASAEIVIAPHGTNLTNLIFCQPGTKVVEILSPYFINVTHWTMSNHVGLDYYYLLGNKLTTKISLGLLKMNCYRDIEVDMNRLSSMMKLIGIEK